MGRLGEFCAVIFVLFVLSKWGVESFELDEFSSKNSSKVSLLESLSHLESVYGVSAAAVPPNALMVPLTLVPGAAAKGAGTISLSQIKSGILFFSFAILPLFIV